MKAYLQAFRLSLQTALQYRVNSMFFLTLVLIRPLALYFLWRTILENGADLGAYTLPAMVTYYVVTQFFVVNTPFGAWAEIGNSIRNGRLVLWLTRPASHFGLFLAQVLGGSLFLWLIGLAGIAVVAVILGPSFQVQTNPALVLAALAFWLGGVVLGYTFGYMLNLVAFWTQRVSGLSNLADLLVSFLSGSVIPLDLLPFKGAWLFLPFRFAGWFPAQVYLGRVGWSQMPAEFGWLVMWIVVFIGLATWLWRAGLRRFQGAGV
jgi:ABC-2 type transport system permease protein